LAEPARRRAPVQEAASARGQPPQGQAREPGPVRELVPALMPAQASAWRQWALTASAVVLELAQPLRPFALAATTAYWAQAVSSPAAARRPCWDRHDAAPAVRRRASARPAAAQLPSK
jgi:hypothetical protein